MSLFLEYYLFLPKMVCKELQQIFLQNTMKPRILCLFNCVLHKRKINQNTLRFFIIERNRDTKFITILITEQQLPMYCVE
jgi:hypothetical protein